MAEKPKQTCAFPTAMGIPEAHRVSPVEQMGYLVGGELRGWDGPSQEGLSPICVRQDGGISQKVLGHYPLLGEVEAMDTDFATVPPTEPLDEVYSLLMGRNRTVAVVVDQGGLLDILSLEGIGWFFMIRSAMKTSQQAGDLSPPLPQEEPRL